MTGANALGDWVVLRWTGIPEWLACRFGIGFSLRHVQYPGKETRVARLFLYCASWTLPYVRGGKMQ